MKKTQLIIPLFLILLLILGACGSSGTATDQVAIHGESASMAPAASPVYPEEAPAAGREVYDGGGYDMMDDSAVMEEAVAEPETGGAGVSVQEITADTRKIITTMDLSLQTTTFDEGTEEIVDMVEEFEGYLEDSYVQGTSMYDKYYTRSASYTARVPSAALDAFVNTLSERFHVVHQQQSASDISEHYYDTEARLKSLRTQEERLIEMLESAGELEYLIQVQQALADVQYQIESITSSLRRMDNQVSMSTVTIHLQEVSEYDENQAAPVGFVQRLQYTFGDSWSNFAVFFQELVLGVILMLPFLLLIAAILAVIILLVRASRKRKRKQTPPQPPATGYPPQPLPPSQGEAPPPAPNQPPDQREGDQNNS